MSIARLAGIAASMGCVALAWANAPRADDWAQSAVGPGGFVYETDVSSVTRTGGMVRSWDRVLLARPRRDEASGKPYLVELEERFDDCEHHRFQLGSFVRRDAQGAVVYSGSTVARGWQETSPGSVAESLGRMACAVASPPAEPPIQADLREGSWSDLGASADGKYRLQVRIDGVRKLDGGPVIAISRSIYGKPEWIEGFAVRYVVSGVAIDCAAGKSATLGADLFVSPTVRVKAFRMAKSDISFQTAGPNSFLARSLQLICAAAAPEKPKPEAEEQGVSVGTAWGAEKGYLVTASHVVSGGNTIEVYSSGEKIGEARIVADDPTNDLAVLKLTPAKPGKITILPFSTRPASLGRSIFTLGYPEPDSLGQRIKMTAGEVSSTAGQNDDARFLQISAPIQQGNSGGPVIAWDGSVLGVVESKLTKFGDDPAKLAPEMVNYALKVSYLRPMLEDLPDLGNYTAVKAVGDHDQLVQEARKAVFMVVASP
jgi:S1-C subfamily serine protease